MTQKYPFVSLWSWAGALMGGDILKRCSSQPFSDHKVAPSYLHALGSLTGMSDQTCEWCKIQERPLDIQVHKPMPQFPHVAKKLGSRNGKKNMDLFTVLPSRETEVELHGSCDCGHLIIWRKSWGDMSMCVGWAARWLSVFSLNAGQKLMSKGKIQKPQFQICHSIKPWRTLSYPEWIRLSQYFF